MLVEPRNARLMNVVHKHLYLRLLVTFKPNETRKVLDGTQNHFLVTGCVVVVDEVSFFRLSKMTGPLDDGLYIANE
jgi:hypothetical protein